MGTVLGNQRPPRGPLALPRILAAVLFALAAIVGLPTLLIAPIAAFEADGRVLGIAAVLASIACGLAWLGAVIWSGRPIPRWFLLAFGLATFAAPVAVVLTRGTWAEASALLVLLPMAGPFWSALRGHPQGTA